jgi:hypothetical protein
MNDCITEAVERLLDLMHDDRPPAETRDRPYTLDVYHRQATSEADSHRRRTDALWRAWGWLTT